MGARPAPMLIGSILTGSYDVELWLAHSVVAVNWGAYSEVTHV